MYDTMKEPNGFERAAKFADEQVKTMNEVDIIAEDMAMIADNYFLAKKKLDEYQEEFDNVKKKLLECAKEEYEVRAFRDEFTKTFNIPGCLTPGVKVTFSDSFKSISDKAVDKLEKSLGDDFPNLFSMQHELTFKGDEKEVSDIKAACKEHFGNEYYFDKAFKYKKKIIPNNGLDKSQFKYGGLTKIVNQFDPKVQLLTKEK